MKIASFVLFFSLITMGAGDIENGDFGATGNFFWDAPATNSDGTPLTDLAGYEIAAYRSTEDPRTVPTAVPVWKGTVAAPATTQDLQPIVVALKTAGAAEGSRWLFMVRAVDTVGNLSAWSNSWAGNLNSLPPSPPGGFGCATTPK